jgi:predicted ArsR family transcriptional regulator
VPKKKLTTEAEKVLAAITSDPNGVPRSALTQPLGYLSTTVDAALVELQKAGYPIEVKTVRSGKRGRPATYFCLASNPKTKKAKPAAEPTPVDANISISIGRYD